MKKFLPFVLGVLALGLLSVGQILETEDSEVEEKRFSEKVNLALRQTGHQLLKIQGDEESTIAPIRVLPDNEFVLKIEKGFNYDTLPQVLEGALADFEIEGDYQVTVKNCESETLILGYNHTAFQNDNVGCLGREQKSDCVSISLIFNEKNASTGRNNFTILSLVLIGLTLILQLFFFKNRKKETIGSSALKNRAGIKVGNSDFDYANQAIVVNGKQKSLTFRENKLLHYFAARQNQVLEREEILSNVWGDEGLIVGRSLDVFVSRLRKILKEDSSVQLKNVHGVGYRMVVSV